MRAGRWRKLGPHSVGVTPTPQPREALWRALLEIGSLSVLDGPSALIVAGLRNIECDAVFVSVPKSAHRQRSTGVVVHETRRFREEAVIRSGIPRMRPATAAVHAALWVPSEKQAALYVVAGVQQRILTADQFAAEVVRVVRNPRLNFLRTLVAEVGDGIQSIGEREFARLCRKRGLPVPTRQVLRQGPTGRVYLDVHWAEFKISVEIDGIHHLDPRSVIDDSLKQNALTLEGLTVLRVPVAALRTDPGPFLDQVETALRLGGWQGP